MSLKNRITTGAAALALVAGGVFAAPAAANAANLVWKSDGYSTKSACLFGESSARGIIAGGGGTIYGGESCTYRGTVSKWGFSLLYTR